MNAKRCKAIRKAMRAGRVDPAERAYAELTVSHRSVRVPDRQVPVTVPMKAIILHPSCGRAIYKGLKKEVACQTRR